MKLYSFFRSSSSYRVRIALNLKGLSYEYVPVHLSRGGGEQFTPAFRGLNPQALVPVLQDGDTRLVQSLAIIEYLDEIHPPPPLLPDTPVGRARAGTGTGHRLRDPSAQQSSGAALSHRDARRDGRRQEYLVPALG